MSCWCSLPRVTMNAGGPVIAAMDSTICSDNGPAIVGACRAFVLFCRDQGLFAARLVALDGSKFRAVSSCDSVARRNAVERYLDSCEKADEEQQASISQLKSEMQTMVAQLKDQAAQIQRVSAQLEVSKLAPQVVANKP